MRFETGFTTHQQFQIAGSVVLLISHLELTEFLPDYCFPSSRLDHQGSETPPSISKVLPVM